MLPDGGGGTLLFLLPAVRSLRIGGKSVLRNTLGTCGNVLSLAQTVDSAELVVESLAFS